MHDSSKVGQLVKSDRQLPNKVAAFCCVSGMCLSYAPVVIVALAHPRSGEVVEHPGIHFQGDHCMVIDVTMQLGLSVTLPRVWSNATIVAIKATIYRR